MFCLDRFIKSELNLPNILHSYDWQLKGWNFLL